MLLLFYLRNKKFNQFIDSVKNGNLFEEFLLIIFFKLEEFKNFN